MSFSFIKLLKHFSNTNMPPLLHLVKTILMNKKLCCWSAVVSIAISCTIFELFDVEHVRNLEIWVSGHSRSLKLVPFKSLGTVSYSPSIVTMAVSCMISVLWQDVGRKSWFFTPPCIRYGLFTVIGQKTL